MVSRRCAIQHGHAPTEFLMCGAECATIPHTDCEARAGDRKWRSLQQIRSRRNRRVHIVRCEIKRRVADEIGQFHYRAIWLHHAHRQSACSSEFQRHIAPRPFDCLHPPHDVRALDRVGEIHTGEQIGEGLRTTCRSKETGKRSDKNPNACRHAQHWRIEFREGIFRRGRS
jgi:hypothetical protein